MAIDKIKLNSLGTTGTASSSNFLRGDMAWTAIAGDIESVTAGTGLNGGGSSGDVTLNVDAAQTTITSLASNVVINTSGAITTTGAFTSIGIDDNAASTTMTINSSQRIGIGTANEPSIANTITPELNISGSGGSGAAQITRHTALGTDGAFLNLAATRGGDVNSYTVLQSGDGVGTIAWCGADGDQFRLAAQIAVTVDGTPGNDDMPGKMSFGTTVDGGTGPTERMTIDNAGIMNLYDNVFQRPMLKDYSETKQAMAANAVDLTLGNVQTYTLSGSQTLTFTNPIASGNSSSFTLLVTNGGSATLTWPASVDWAGGTAPTLTSSGIDAIVFTTIDGGTIWYGFAAGLDLS